MQEVKDKKEEGVAPASVGRIVHVYSTAWNGPRPGIVMQPPKVEGDQQLITVNVFLDGVSDVTVLAAFRKRSAGNTITSVPLVAPAEGVHPQAVQRDLGDGVTAGVWCVWPPRV